MKDALDFGSIETEHRPMAEYIYQLNKTRTGMVVDFNDSITEIPPELAACFKKRPKGIDELTEGVSFDNFSYKTIDEKTLGLLGFFNVQLKNYKKVVIVEFAQTGRKECGSKLLRYGIGARMMLKVNQASWLAKINSPQQISASVVFNRATVEYSIKTFGIVGPGVASLVKAGTLHEDSYSNFIKEVSNLILEIYKNKSLFTITPQPMFI